MFKYQTKKRNQYYKEVVDLHFTHGMSANAISMRLPISRKTISRWISIFAASNNEDMKQDTRCKQPENQQEKHDGGRSLEEENNQLREEIKCLTAAAKREKLRADLNEEIINVAERKFGIQIRKKAGTKQ